MIDTITLSLPIDTPLPVPFGEWWCDGRRIIANYTLLELAWALCCTDSWRLGLKRLEELEVESKKGAVLVRKKDADISRDE